jgi:hypothetical protein
MHAFDVHSLHANKPRAWHQHARLRYLMRVLCNNAPSSSEHFFCPTIQRDTIPRQPPAAITGHLATLRLEKASSVEKVVRFVVPAISASACPSHQNHTSVWTEILCFVLDAQSTLAPTVTSQGRHISLSSAIMSLQSMVDVPLLVSSPNSSSERRISPSWTIAHLKSRLEPITGVPASCQQLSLRVGSQDAVPITAADEEQTRLTSFPLQPYAEITVSAFIYSASYCSLLPALS